MLADGSALVLRLRKPKPSKKVDWKKEVVDNEFMNKKKSKRMAGERVPPCDLGRAVAKEQ